MGGGRSNAIDPNTMNYATGADTMISPAHLTELGAGRRKLSKYIPVTAVFAFPLTKTVLQELNRESCQTP